MGDQPGPPPWGTVLVTTVRLWGRRRAWLWPGRARWRVLVVLVAAAVLFGAGAITIGLARSSPAGPAGSPAPIQAAATVRQDAATWVARQVAADAIVGCDRQMCAALQAAGISASRLLVLGTGATSGPSASDVVISTEAVRMEYGSQLTGVYAPAVLASFGSGNAQVAIREVAADGAAAFQSSMQADRQARQYAGAAAAGQPRDPRAARRGPRAGRRCGGRAAAQQHRRAEPPVPAGHHRRRASRSRRQRRAAAALRRYRTGRPGRPGAGSIASIRTFLLAQQAPYLPASITVVRLASGQTVLRVAFTAPAPLGLLGARSDARRSRR